MATNTIGVSEELARALSTRSDEVLQALASRLGARIFLRGDEVTVDADAAAGLRTLAVLAELEELVTEGLPIGPQTIDGVVGVIEGTGERAADVLNDVVWRHRGKRVAPKTLNQKRYVDAIRSSTITFGIGPAGTGKTYLAIALAVSALVDRDVSRIILTRPAVEAGERLGFLPGDLMAKVDPYLRPLFDALLDMLDAERVTSYLERGTIEVAPLAFMRGRTLNDSFIILDEAQNTTPEQMQMFLTRLGFGSRVVVTGDVTQVDLPRGQRPGLADVVPILTDVTDISFIQFDRDDVVRHKLVQSIVEAYRAHHEAREEEATRSAAR